MVPFTRDLGDGLTLRQLEERDAAALFTLTDRERHHLREWLPWLDHSTGLADTQAFIRGALRQAAEDNGFQAGIWLGGDPSPRVGQALAGVIGFHAIDRANRKTSLGYWLGEQFGGRGLMTRACRALVDHAFAPPPEGFGLNRVEIRCATGNRKSCAIPERLGFAREGTLRQVEWLYDHFVDHHVYGMLAAEWGGAAG